MDVDGPIDIPSTLGVDGLAGDALSTYWPALVAGLITLALVALLIRALRRRPVRRGRAVAIWVPPAGLAALLTAALAFNTWTGYFPSVAALESWAYQNTRSPVTQSTASADGALDLGTERRTTDTRGHVFRSVVASTSAGVPDATASVYLPPDYDRADNTARYPVVYALHGSPGTGTDWFTAGQLDTVLDRLIAGGQLAPVIVVAPDVNAGDPQVLSEPLNRPDGGPQLEDFLVRDVVPWADGHLRTVADAGRRIVAGMSAGGFGALMQGLHHPDVFRGVVTIMPYLSPVGPGLVSTPELVERNTPLGWLARTPPDPAQRIFLGQGDGEARADADLLRERLGAGGTPATVRVLPGLGHTWVAARTIMPYGLVWTADQLGWRAS